MDKTDVILCQLLLMNSRLSYRRLADMLNLSVAAVHNRIQSLIDAGVIRKFTAKISLAALKAVHVILFGTSKYGLVRDLNVKMANHGSIYWLAIGGGNMLYIGAYLKSIDELGSLVNYVKEAAGVSGLFLQGQAFDGSSWTRCPLEGTFMRLGVPGCRSRIAAFVGV